MPQTHEFTEPGPSQTGWRKRFACWISGLTIYGALAVSLGWYYTFTYYGKTGIPMPHPESCASILLYYFSVLNVETEIQALHWIVVFPVSGGIWAWALRLVARRQGIAGPAMPLVYFCMACACIPMILPTPFMAFLAGLDGGSFSADRMLRVALRRGNRAPDAWLTPLYLSLGAVSFAVQCMFMRRMYPQRFWSAVRHYFVAAIVLLVACMAIGLAASYPLRYWLE
ncbi:MAG: hypothetical protein AMXMBFR84_20130 [Candidatus Hydrogenedentota bacterium]